MNGVPIVGNPFVRTVAPLASNLSLSVTSTASNPVVGDTVTIVMTVVNHGTAPATAAKLASEIPFERFTVLSLTVSRGSFDLTTRIWSLGTVAPQATATLTFRGVVRLFPSP